MGAQAGLVSSYGNRTCLDPTLVYVFTLAEGEERELLGGGGVSAKLRYLRFQFQFSRNFIFLA